MSTNTRKVAFFDLDGTLIEAHLFLGLAKYNFKFKKNRIETLCYILRHILITPFWFTKLISKEKYYRSWGENVSQMIKNTETIKMKDILTWLSDEYLLPTIKRKILKKLEQHQKEGFLTILTSGSFENLLEVIADRLKIDFFVGTRLENIDGRFTGKIIPPFCFGSRKVERIKQLMKDQNFKIDFKESFAYSDGIFDLPMLELVANPVVVDPDKNLLKIAQNKNWELIL